MPMPIMSNAPASPVMGMAGKRPMRKAFLPRRMAMPDSQAAADMGPPQVAADPNEALNQFSKEQLGGAEYRINRRHPARAPKIAAGSPYQGMTAGQAALATESDFRGLPDSGKAAALERSRALEFTPPSPAPLVQNATAPRDAFLPRPMMQNPNMAGSQKATGQPLGTMTSTLAPPKKATGEPLGTMKFAKLPTRPMRR